MQLEEGDPRLKWLTALLVQHYEGFHPDLVALNRQPTNQRRVKREVQEAPSERSLASLHENIFSLAVSPVP
ncbi:hypothetical protein K0M31_014544 [Melipona bicolor]|uniref:Uncharacterized protein n=1 Tax=Melipona bicolor TaxID=60889 RepID=A0AA40G9I2_9HYME|nr:hypothetical protein K0M31_014544 [Melipona bicolor]